ncbi:restriction endonuclease [Kitasatospora sp. NPDC057940]|uniref:restriction endonuclease n=1 Tax=Kitasatospora sp. NPDC057940 TaxID=3346285 RepID=UPI0036DD4C5D
MNPYDFEHLVRELFEAMGYETWRTQGSRDDGVDAVATLSDPTGSTIFAIQAKRSKNVVPVNTVRAMSGVMHDKDAGYIVVTTSWFGKDSYDFAHRNGRLRLIGGRNLKTLLAEHLNIDALIGLPKVPRAGRPATSCRRTRGRRTGLRRPLGRWLRSLAGPQQDRKAAASQPPTTCRTINKKAADLGFLPANGLSDSRRDDRI